MRFAKPMPRGERGTRVPCANHAARILPVAVLLLALVGTGCQSKSGLAPGLSGMRTDMTVLGTASLGPYRVAHLDMNGKALDAYVLPSEACNDVFETGATVTYVDNGPQGVYQRGDARCQGMGVGNLLVWRNRSRNSSPVPVPRTQVSFHVIARGDQYALLRGQFPGAAIIGFTGDYDIVAVVPEGGECASILEQRTASMEYRDKGSRVFSLIGKTGLCDIHGFAQPPPPQPATEARGPGAASGVDEAA